MNDDDIQIIAAIIKDNITNQSEKNNVMFSFAQWLKKKKADFNNQKFMEVISGGRKTYKGNN